MDMFSDSEFRNWIKACLAIKCVKDGMLPLIDYYCNKHSTDNIGHITQKCRLVSYTCNQCDIKTLKPFHKPVQCTYNKKCECRFKSKKTCPENGACGVIYDQIKASHVSNNPNWSNTDSTLWSRSPWEQMKCYIVTSGYEETKNICEADITALLQICFNNIEIKGLFYNNDGCFHEVRRIRNDICHSSEMKVSDKFMQHVFCQATTLLMEVEYTYPDCHPEIEHALNVLQTLEEDDFVITTQHESDAMYDVMKQTLKDMKEQEYNRQKIVQNLNTKINVNKGETDKLMQAHEQRIDICRRDILRMEQNQREQAQKESTIGKDMRKDINLIFDMLRAFDKRVEGLEGLETKANQTTANEVMPPTVEIMHDKLETKITIHAENVEDVAAYEDITERMNDVANGIINQQPVQQRNISLRTYADAAFQIIQRGRSRITKHKIKCVELYIESPSMQSWLTLFEDFSNGTIAMGLQPIQRYLRFFEGCANLTLRIELDEEYFARCAKASIVQLHSRLNYLPESKVENDVVAGFYKSHEETYTLKKENDVVAGFYKSHEETYTLKKEALAETRTRAEEARAENCNRMEEAHDEECNRMKESRKWMEESRKSMEALKEECKRIEALIEKCKRMEEAHTDICKRMKGNQKRMEESRKSMKALKEECKRIEALKEECKRIEEAHTEECKRMKTNQWWMEVERKMMEVYQWYMEVERKKMEEHLKRMEVHFRMEETFTSKKEALAETRTRAEVDRKMMEEFRKRQEEFRKSEEEWRKWREEFGKKEEVWRKNREEFRKSEEEWRKRLQEWRKRREEIRKWQKGPQRRPEAPLDVSPARPPSPPIAPLRRLRTPSPPAKPPSAHKYKLMKDERKRKEELSPIDQTCDTADTSITTSGTAGRNLLPIPGDVKTS